MPEKDTLKRAMNKKRRGKKPSTQAGEFVREEMHHIREGKHGARSTKQAIAIGLSKARRSGVNLPPPQKGKTSERTRTQAKRDYQKGRSRTKSKTAPRRRQATLHALRREGRGAASHEALAQQARQTAKRRRRRVRPAVH
jgi:uncharacterized protein DUF6496